MGSGRVSDQSARWAAEHAQAWAKGGAGRAPSGAAVLARGGAGPNRRAGVPALPASPTQPRCRRAPGSHSLRRTLPGGLEGTVQRSASLQKPGPPKTTKLCASRLHRSTETLYRQAAGSACFSPSMAGHRHTGRLRAPMGCVGAAVQTCPAQRAPRSSAAGVLRWSGLPQALPGGPWRAAKQQPNARHNLKTRWQISCNLLQDCSWLGTQRRAGTQRGPRGHRCASTPRPASRRAAPGGKGSPRCCRGSSGGHRAAPATAFEAWRAGRDDAPGGPAHGWRTLEAGAHTPNHGSPPLQPPQPSRHTTPRRL